MQSKKGLHIQDIGSYGVVATYEKAEPRNLKYCIDYFGGKYKEKENYKILAKDAGWNYAGSFDEYMIFVSEEGTTPIPLYTDWKEEYKLMRKGLWNYEFPLGIITIVMLAIFLSQGSVDIVTLEQKIFGFCLLCMMGFGLTGMLHGILVYWKTIRAIRRDTPMGTVPTQNAKRLGMMHAAFDAGVAIGMALRLCLTMQDCVAEGNTGPIVFCLTWLLSTLALYIVGKLPENLLPKKVDFILNMLLLFLIVAGLIGLIFSI